MRKMNMVDHLTANHLSEANTGQIITGITGLASQLIANKNAGTGSPEANKVASLSEQTLAAVLAAQGVTQQNQQPATVSPNYLIFGAVAMVALLVIIMVVVTKSKK